MSSSVLILAEVNPGAIIVIALLIVLFFGLWAAFLMTEAEEARKEEERQRKKLEKEHRRQLQEAAWQSQQLVEEAERQRLAAQQSAYDKQIVLANAEREMKKQQLLSANLEEGASLDLIVNQRLLHQARQGRVMNVHFVAVPAGRLVIQWSVTCDGPLVPLVTGFRDGKRIFSEHSFAGEHPDQVTRGVRYVYSFRVQRDGRLIEKEDEFLFEVIIPTPAQWNRPTGFFFPPTPPEDPAVREKKLIEDKSKAAANRIEAIARAMRETEQRLRAQGLDEETIQRTLAQLEAKLTEELDK